MAPEPAARWGEDRAGSEGLRPSVQTRFPLAVLSGSFLMGGSDPSHPLGGHQDGGDSGQRGGRSLLLLPVTCRSFLQGRWPPWGQECGSLAAQGLGLCHHGGRGRAAGEPRGFRAGLVTWPRRGPHSSRAPGPAPPSQSPPSPRRSAPGWRGHSAPCVSPGLAPSRSSVSSDGRNGFASRPQAGTLRCDMQIVPTVPQ